MTRSALNKIAKDNKVDLSMYDSVSGTINDNYTYITIMFGVASVCGGYKDVKNIKRIVKSVSAIMKAGEFIPEDFETKGFTYIDYIR